MAIAVIACKGEVVADLVKAAALVKAVVEDHAATVVADANIILAAGADARNMLISFFALRI